MSGLHYSRIQSLRQLMRRRGWDAVVLTGGDPHASENPAPRWKQVEWLTGFTGEAGDVVVTLDEAGLWTDPRYFIQAEKELHLSQVELHKTRVNDAVLIPEWLAGQDFISAREDPDDTRPVIIAIDPLCTSVSFAEEIRQAFSRKWMESDFGEPFFRIAGGPDLIDDIWTDRPAVPSAPVTSLSTEITGESRLAKIGRIRSYLEENSLDCILVSALDEIAWTLNVRGNDTDYDPLVLSYLLVGGDSVKWFVKKGGRPDEETADTFAEIEDDGIAVLPYDDISLELGAFALPGETRSLQIDTLTLNYGLYCLLRDNPSAWKTVEGTSPVRLFKAVKNNVETESLREAHIEDGVAMEQFLYWLERSVPRGISEWEAARRLDAFRSEIPGFRGNSFETISAYGENAALPHYRTPSKGSAILYENGLYLVDSGGQYPSGTTDITRTVPLGPCTALEKEDYTLVLKGMIDLALAIFPKGTAGCQLDVLARNPLWQSKRNFAHSTGHGVGQFLCVHEGPQSIRQDFNDTPILPGMVTSDEPGIYREGKFGIRHENLLLCVEKGVTPFGEWLGFETLTLCHIDTSIIQAGLLSKEEIAWLNAYNSRVYETLRSRLPSVVAQWLKNKTAPLAGC